MSRVGEAEVSFVPVSRTRQYAEEHANRRRSDARVAELETEVEDSERRNLRLTRELEQEVALRARSERQKDKAKEQVEKLSTELAEAQEKLANAQVRPRKATAKSGKRARAGGKVSKRAQRVDGSPALKRKRTAKPANGSSPSAKAGNPAVRKSSRTRGKVQ